MDPAPEDVTALEDNHESSEGRATYVPNNADAIRLFESRWHAQLGFIELGVPDFVLHAMVETWDVKACWR